MKMNKKILLSLFAIVLMQNIAFAGGMKGGKLFNTQGYVIMTTYCVATVVLCFIGNIRKSQLWGSIGFLLTIPIILFTTLVFVAEEYVYVFLFLIPIIMNLVNFYKAFKPQNN